MLNIDIDNLDGLTDDDLVEASAAFKLLAEYTELALNARVARVQGRIIAAGVLENRMDGIFRELPEWARW
jgi:hypothetical protein